MESKRRGEGIRDLLSKEKQTHEGTFAAALASHASAISLKENQYATAQKRLGDAEKALRISKAEHSVALETLAADRAATIKAKDTDFSEAIAKTEEENHNALTKLRQDHSEAIERQANESSIVFERLKEEHANKLRVAVIAKESSLTESQTAQEKVI